MALLVDNFGLFGKEETHWAIVDLIRAFADCFFGRCRGNSIVSSGRYTKTFRSRLFSWTSREGKLPHVTEDLFRLRVQKYEFRKNPPSKLLSSSSDSTRSEFEGSRHCAKNNLNDVEPKAKRPWTLDSVSNYFDWTFAGLSNHQTSNGQGLRGLPLPGAVRQQTIYLDDSADDRLECTKASRFGAILKVIIAAGVHVLFQHLGRWNPRRTPTCLNWITLELQKTGLKRIS